MVRKPISMEDTLALYPRIGYTLCPSWPLFGLQQLPFCLSNESNDYFYQFSIEMLKVKVEIGLRTAIVLL